MRYYRSNYGENSKQLLDIKYELESMTLALKADESSRFTLRDLLASHPRKAITYGLVLMALNQFCGAFAMMNFTKTIFQESGSTLSPNMSSIIVGAIQIVGAIICTFLVEKLGRKLLLSISAFGISFGLAVMSLYTFLISRGYNLEGFNWIPLMSFSIVLFIYNRGFNASIPVQVPDIKSAATLQVQSSLKVTTAEGK